MSRRLAALFLLSPRQEHGQNATKIAKGLGCGLVGRGALVAANAGHGLRLRSNGRKHCDGCPAGRRRRHHRGPFLLLSAEPGSFDAGRLVSVAISSQVLLSRL